MMTNQDAPKIIVIDENEDDFLLIQQQILTVWKNAVLLHACNLTSLEEILQNSKPDLVICDYSMPNMTHDTAIELIQKLRPDTPFILLSGRMLDNLGIQTLHEDVRDYVEKSKPERLIPAVRRELNTHRLRQEKKLLEVAHRRAVYFDSTTGFLNRQGLVKTLSGLKSKTNQGKDLCIVCINFSKNQARGPEIDPQVRRNMLEKIVSRIRETFDQHILCRWSDNLMVVVTDELNWSAPHAETAEQLSDIEAMLNRPFMIENFPVRPSMRLGLARVGLDGKHINDLITHAQAVAGVLESAGLELFHALDESVHQQAQRLKQIEWGFAKGLEGHEFFLEFQPIEDLRTGHVCGLEALVRWTHPQLGLIMPCEFIDVAEDSGLIDALGNWVIESASKNLIALHEQGHMLWCAVNCSARQLLNPDFPEKVNDMICKAGLDPKWIEFEVTESAAINDITRTVEALKQLKSKGSQVAMDDFGTGYASLNYLRQLPVDILKIDKSFVMDLLEDKSSHMIVKAVIDLAHALGLIVHAEGIETQEQRESLSKMGCDRLQGYWLSRPMNQEALLEWLNKTQTRSGTRN